MAKKSGVANILGLISTPKQDHPRVAKPKLARKAADSYYLAWQGVLHCCRDFIGLQQLTPEIKHQSQDFTDLPEVVQAIQQLVKQRWQELREPLSS